jgi:hypothetical protein
LEILGMENVLYFTAIWYNLWQFGIVYGLLVYFTQFGMFGSRKIWQPWCRRFSEVVENETKDPLKAG